MIDEQKFRQAVREEVTAVLKASGLLTAKAPVNTVYAAKRLKEILG